jgi:hypothetical protein
LRLDAQLAVAAVTVVVDTDPAFAIGALAGASVAVILADARGGIAHLAAKAAVLSSVAIGDALIVDTRKARPAIVVNLTPARSGR